MFLIWGSKHTRKVIGTVEKDFICKHCQNVTPYQIVKDTDWFTIYMMPVIPAISSYRAECPICNFGFDIDKKRAKEIITEIDKNNNE